MSSYFPGPPNGQHTITVSGGAPPQSESGSADSTDTSDALKRAIQAVQDAAQAADDEVERQTLLQCLTKIQSLLAQEQKENEAAMGTSAVHKGLARMSRGNGGY